MRLSKHKRNHRARPAASGPAAPDAASSPSMRKLIASAAAVATGVVLTSMSMAAASAAVAAPTAKAATIVIRPGQSIQRAVNHARPGDTILLKPGVYHQSVLIRTNGITLRGSGASSGGTVLKPPKTVRATSATQPSGRPGSASWPGT